MKKVIAIDGPSGAGKSTIAKMVAKELGFDYLDTGALYRAVALGLLKLGIGESASDHKITSALKKTRVEFRKGKVFLNGKDVSKEIRSPEVSHFASVFSARKPVRAFLLKAQQDAGLKEDLVAEGRDMTTVVFPGAYRKFFLDASVEERIMRRTLDLISRGFEVNEDKIRGEIINRDVRDSSRELAPLKKAEDAYVIDSSGMPIDDVFRKVMEIIRGGQAPPESKKKDMKKSPKTVQVRKTSPRRPAPAIITAKRAGFCFGVKRAIDITFDIAKKDRKGVYTLGPIIHNPQVIQRLKNEGIAPVEVADLERKGIKTLIIRTHGVPCHLYDTISARGFRIIDATCPFVKKAQHYAGILKKSGYQVVILGDIDHPEVKGLMSFAGDDVVVVDGSGPLPGLKSKVGIIVQTTQPVEALKRLLSDIIGHVKEVKVYNTICNSTALRLKETEEMARKVDVMIVVGGKNSANTTQLANLCRSLSVKTFHVETAAELEDRWFKKARHVGVTAGASTPEWIIKEVEKRIRDIGGEARNGT